MTNKTLSVFRYLATVFLLLFGFFYYLKFVDPSLIDFKQQPLFLCNVNFFSQFTLYPKGITEYINLFFLQFFVSKFTGSILLTLFIGLSILFSNLIFKKYFEGNALWFIQFLPGLLLISLHSHYEIDLSTDIVFLSVLLCTWLYQNIKDLKLYIKIPILIVVEILLYYIFSGTALLTLTFFIIAIEIIRFNKKNWYILIPVVIVLAGILPYLTSIHFAYTDFKKGMFGILETGEKDKLILILQLSILAILPILLLLNTLLKAIFRKKNIKAPWTNFIVFSFPVLIIALTVLVMFISFNQNKKNNLLINFYAKNENWKGVLEVAKKLPIEDRKVIFQINRALYHQGRLANEAFSYPQFWGENGLILTTYYNSEVLMYCSDLFYDMGHIRGALHWAYEAQTKFENSPDVLKRIALCNLLLGEYSTAEKFLKILSQSPIHKKWALKYIPYLNNEKLLAVDPTLSEKRKLIPHDDFYSNTKHPQYDLFMLLTQHPENKMAFEYFMIDALMNHDLAKVAVNLKYLKNLGYDKIPVHIEEALMLFFALNKDYKVDLGDYKISTRTQNNFVAFSKLLLKFRQNHKEVQSEMYSQYGNTYWYYVQFISPITTKRVIKENKNQ
jgi:hypothetical protein